MVLSWEQRRSSITKWWFLELIRESTMLLSRSVQYATVWFQTVAQWSIVLEKKLLNMSKILELKSQGPFSLSAYHNSSRCTLFTACTDLTALQLFTQRMIFWRVLNFGWSNHQANVINTGDAQVVVESNLLGMKLKKANTENWQCSRRCQRLLKFWWRLRMKCVKRKWNLS